MKTSPAIVLFGILGTAVVATGAELKHSPPARVDLSGLWKINPDLSDDPYEAVEKKRRASTEGRATRGGGPMGGGRSGGTRLPGGIVVDSGDGVFGDVFGGTVVTGTARGTVGGGGGGGNRDRPAGDPEPSSMRVPLDSFLATVEQFEISQAPDSLTIASDDGTTTCKPADPGQAPLPGGDPGDRRCGWKGDTWVTEIKAPNGLIRTNRYELKKGGRQLVMISEMEGGKSELSGLRIKRVYEKAVLE